MIFIALFFILLFSSLLILILSDFYFYTFLKVIIWNYLGLQEPEEWLLFSHESLFQFGFMYKKSQSKER